MKNGEYFDDADRLLQKILAIVVHLVDTSESGTIQIIMDAMHDVAVRARRKEHTCVVCDCLLLRPTEPPHCETCLLQDDHRHAYEDELDAERELDTARETKVTG